MIEQLRLRQSLEHMNDLREVERKFIVDDPEPFEQYRDYAEKAITQAYLSNPNDEYSLRLRETVTDTGVDYTATLKDRGELTPDGLSRLEVETPIDKKTYDYYLASCASIVRKLRAEPVKGLTIDWIEGLDTPIIEVENVRINQDASRLLGTLENQLSEVTGSKSFDNESLAYGLNDVEPGPSPALDIETVLGDVAAFKAIGKKDIVVTLAGRSGSGKTTVARELAQKLTERYGGAPIVISTDDYHVGKTHLESTYGAPWTNWERGEVYDTAELACDIQRLRRHESVASRAFDFGTQEPLEGRPHIFSPIVIVEGIHAGSRDLAEVRDIHFTVPTTFATSLGRDVARLVVKDRPNESIGTPAERLRYMLETGEPTYQTFERPRRNRFSASVRPLGASALASR